MRDAVSTGAFLSAALTVGSELLVEEPVLTSLLEASVLVAVFD